MQTNLPLLAGAQLRALRRVYDGIGFLNQYNLSSIVPNTLRIATFNIHKGFSHFNAHFSLHQQRELLRKLHADIIFLQEVQDEHVQKSVQHKTWPQNGQAEFLADSIWQDYAYGKNSVYPAGHHGNALMSKFPIMRFNNVDISAHKTEQRGFLHSEIDRQGTTIHTFCVHLGLFANWRRSQLQILTHYIERHVPANAPLIIAGDFNDWSGRGGRSFATHLHLKEVFESHHGKPTRSFPSWLPMLRLDRIYVRNLTVKHAEIQAGLKLLKVSDHAILTATLSL